MVLPIIMRKESHRRINGNGSVSEGCTDFISIAGICRAGKGEFPEEGPRILGD